MPTLYLFNGLGAGNIGDEAMFLGWRALGVLSRDDVVEVYDPALLPEALRSLDFRWTPYEATDLRSRHLRECESVVLLGDTPITELHGTAWPLEYHVPLLRQCQDVGKSVEAIGVGVDELRTPEALRLFAHHREAVSCWSTRSARCANALAVMGVEAERIHVAADLAWLLETSPADVHFARGLLASLGERGELPLLALNCVNENWTGDDQRLMTLANLLLEMRKTTAFRVLLLCNETRPGEYFDYACAVRLKALLGEAACLVPNHYFTPSQMAGLISLCKLSISQRYHFSVLSILANVPVAVFSRGGKLMSLAEDVAAPIVGDMKLSDPALFLSVLTDSWRGSEPLRRVQQQRRGVLGLRALGVQKRHASPQPVARLASVEEASSLPFRTVSRQLAVFSQLYSLSFFLEFVHHWTYPWLWFNLFRGYSLARCKVLVADDVDSVLPWWLGVLGAQVTLVSAKPEAGAQFAAIRAKLAVNVDRCGENGTGLLASNSVDIVCANSTWNASPEKLFALEEYARLLKPGGHLVWALQGAASDWASPDGQTLRSVGGSHSAFSMAQPPAWNADDLAAYAQWRYTHAPQAPEIVAAAILRKCPT